jgi:dienelactone hydrolase
LQVEGWRIIGDLVKPRAPRPIPAVLLLNKAAGDRQVYAGLAARLAERGIASLRLDLRGHGESVNQGKFIPTSPPEQRLMLEGEDQEIAAATRYLQGLPGIDARRLGYVGASYSGEMMMVAARKHGYGKAYVALSPGSFSEESLAGIDQTQLPFLFVRSTQERSRAMQEFYTNLRQRSRTAQFLEVGGTEHATDALIAHPELAEIIAVWLAHKLREPVATPR